MLINGIAAFLASAPLIHAKTGENRMDEKPRTDTATFAGGCFWCMQPPFDNTRGVVKTTVGYTGGHVPDPTYEQVCDGTTGHAEAIEVIYDPAVVSYDRLLDVFWRSIDPTQKNGQFADRGTQYRTAIFFHDDDQKTAAESSRRRLDESGKFDRPVVTEITAASRFYPAEDYHQGYYEKNAAHYERYKTGSGRGPFIERVWKAEK